MQLTWFFFHCFLFCGVNPFFIIKLSYHVHKPLVVSTVPNLIAKLDNTKFEEVAEGVET